MGGDELAIVMLATPMRDSGLIGERLRLVTRDLAVPVGKQATWVSLSVGIAQPGRSESVQDWPDRADRALDRARGGAIASSRRRWTTDPFRPGRPVTGRPAQPFDWQDTPRTDRHHPGDDRHWLAQPSTVCNYAHAP